MASLVTNAGLAAITALLAGASYWIGWGTGSGQTAISTDLATAANESRVAATLSQQTTTVTDDTFRATGTITATGARAITEAGLFDAAGSGNPPSGGNMDFYGDFTVINLSTDDSIAFTWDIDFS